MEKLKFPHLQVWDEQKLECCKSSDLETPKFCLGEYIIEYVIETSINMVFLHPGLCGLNDLIKDFSR